MKAVISSLITDKFLSELHANFPDVDFEVAETPDEQKLHIKDADVFLGVPSREVFLAADKLRWLQCPGTGIDRIMAVPEILDSDVVVTNARGPHANPIADHTMGMIISFAHNLRELYDDQKAHRWDLRKYDQRMVELGGSTMGILALGDIGSAVARRAHAFGMDVYAVDAREMDPPPEVKEVWGTERLDDLLKISDWFVITVPFTEKTKGLIDRRRIEMMKPGAHLIVVSRGEIVDEEALVDALRSGHLAGAGLDVTAVEPLPADNPLWDLENVVITPHVSALTAEMWEGRRQIFQENLRRFLANEPFLYVCNKREGY